MCITEVVMLLLLTLALVTMIADLIFDKAFRVMVLRLHKWKVILVLFLYCTLWNKMQSEKMSISLWPGDNSSLSGSKVGNIAFNWLLESTIKLLIFCFYFKVIFSKDRWYKGKLTACLALRRYLVMWFGRRETVLN